MRRNTLSEYKDVEVIDVGFVKVGWTWDVLTEMINKFHYILMMEDYKYKYINDEWSSEDIDTIVNIEVMLMSEPEEIYLNSTSVGVIVSAWGVVNEYEADGGEYEF